jgi:hypothetical protein
MAIADQMRPSTPKHCFHTHDVHEMRCERKSFSWVDPLPHGIASQAEVAGYLKQTTQPWDTTLRRWTMLLPHHPDPPSFHGEGSLYANRLCSDLERSGHTAVRP